MENLFEIKRSYEEIKTVLFETNSCRVEKIILFGNPTNWYDQNEGEWVSVIYGEAELAFEDKTLLLKQGDNLYIPAHERHKVLSTSNPCVWLCIFVKDIDC
jgi:cupin 2 domain-containing protein